MSALSISIPHFIGDPTQCNRVRKRIGGHTYWKGKTAFIYRLHNGLYRKILRHLPKTPVEPIREFSKAVDVRSIYKNQLYFYIVINKILQL